MLPSPTTAPIDDGELPEREGPAEMSAMRAPALDLVALRPHVVTLHDGLFAPHGMIPTTSRDVDAIFDQHLPRWWTAHAGPLRIVLWAHGGLNDEAAGLA